MERSFAIARSRDKACGICMEVILEKQPSDKKRFGLLPNCSHCFCLDCIRTWRQVKQFENKIIRYDDDHFVTRSDRLDNFLTHFLIDSFAFFLDRVPNVESIRISSYRVPTGAKRRRRNRNSSKTTRKMPGKSDWCHFHF